MPPCMKGRAASLEFLFLREKVPFACCVGEMGFALLYRGGRVMFSPGGNGKGRNVPAFFRVLCGKRKGMGLVVRGEGGFWQTSICT